MQAELIDRVQAIENIQKHISEIEGEDIKEVYRAFIDFLNKLPVAYDVEKVVEQLENSEGMCKHKCCQQIIEVVRNG